MDLFTLKEFDFCCSGLRIVDFEMKISKCKKYFKTPKDIQRLSDQIRAYDVTHKWLRMRTKKMFKLIWRPQLKTEVTT